MTDISHIIPFEVFCAAATIILCIIASWGADKTDI